MPVQCYRCGKFLCNEQSLYYHLNKKVKCNSLTCDTCRTVFKTKLEMRMHKCGKSPVKNVYSPPKFKNPEVKSDESNDEPRRRKSIERKTMLKNIEDIICCLKSETSDDTKQKLTPDMFKRSYP